MGLYVEITAEGGQKAGWMEILREEKLRPGDEYGEYSYRYRYNDFSGRGLMGGSGVLHRRADPVFELVKACLTHSEPASEYCGGCHCEFVPATSEEYITESTLYRKVDVRAET